MERFLWTLFFSIISITLCIFLFTILEKNNFIRIQEYISYENIKKLFETLSINKLPEKEDIEKYDYKNLINLILIIYLISCVLGYLSYKLIRLINIDSYIPAFRFKNYWHYLAKSKKINGNKNSKNKYLYTNADVLIEIKDKTDLYSGYVQNYFIDSATNKLDCIILKNAYKFITIENDKNQDIEASINKGENVYEKHKTYSNKTVYKKFIPGDILTIFNDRIININFTYVEQVLNQNERRKIIINSFFYITTSIVLITPWLIQHDLTTTIKRKIIISYIFYNILVLTKNFLLESLNLTDKPLGFKNFISGIIFSLIPLLWFFKISSAIYTTIFIVIYFIILMLISNDNDKK